MELQLCDDISGLYQVLTSDLCRLRPVALMSVDLRAEVRNLLAEVEVSQKYQNKENNPLEVVYFFPVEEEASVVACKATFDGKANKTIDDNMWEKKRTIKLETR